MPIDVIFYDVTEKKDNSLHISKTQYVWSIYKLLKKQLSYNNDRNFTLIFQGCVLEKHNKIQDYSIEDGSIVMVLVESSTVITREMFSVHRSPRRRGYPRTFSSSVHQSNTDSYFIPRTPLTISGDRLRRPPPPSGPPPGESIEISSISSLLSIGTPGPPPGVQPSSSSSLLPIGTPGPPPGVQPSSSSLLPIGPPASPNDENNITNLLTPTELINRLIDRDQNRIPIIFEANMIVHNSNSVDESDIEEQINLTDIDNNDINVDDDNDDADDADDNIDDDNDDADDADDNIDDNNEDNEDNDISSDSGGVEEPIVPFPDINQNMNIVESMTRNMHSNNEEHTREFFTHMYYVQIEQMVAMGYLNNDLILDALIIHNGDINESIEWLS